MAEITLEPTALSKVIPISLKINDTDATAVTRLATKRQFNTSDTDAWLSFTLEGLERTSGAYDLTMFNVDEKPIGSIVHHTNVAFSTIPFHYKLDSGTDLETNEIRHAGRWIGQIVVRMANGDTTSRQFDFAISGNLLDGNEARLILVEDYNALIATITASKDELTQYNIDYSTLLTDINAAKVAMDQAEINRAATFDALVDSEMIAQNVATKLTEKEATFAPRMLSLESELAEKVTWVTPEEFGAVGDGIADDTTALQNAIYYAIENDKKFIATSKYLTSRTILIKSNYKLFGFFDFEKSTVTYSGTGSAFLLQGYNGATFKFGYIEALNGNCIEFYSELGTEDRTQYCNLSFLRLKANQTNGKCIYIHNALVGWTNQNVVYGGEFTGGYYGIYIEENASSTTYTINGWQFHNMGFEGCEINIYIKANSNAVNGLLFDGVRFEEHKVLLTRIDGTVSNVTINVVSGEIKRSHLSFLNQDLIVNITVNGVVVSEDASQLLGYGFNLTQFNERYLMYYTANTAQIVSALNSEADGSVNLTNATGYGNIEKKGKLCIIKFTSLVATAAYVDILNNPITALYTPKTLTNGVLATSDGYFGRIWLRKNGTFALSIDASAVGKEFFGELVYFTA